MEILNAQHLSQKNCVLLIGNLIQEGVTTKIKTLGYEYKQKILSSSNRNWLKTVSLIQQLNKSNGLVTIFVHFTPSVIFRAAHKDYKDVWEALLKEFSETNTHFFIYEDNLNGNFTPDSEMWGISRPYRSSITDNEAFNLIRNIYDSNITIIPYKKRIDLTLHIQHTLDEIESGTFFRLYVPTGRLQANQVAAFLNIFENYLNQIEKVRFSIDSNKTEHGTLYKFKSKDRDVDLQNLETSLDNFENFMDLVERDIEKATEILIETGINKPDANEITSRYSKLYRRLKLDIKHEFEIKSLALRHRLESEILDFSETSITFPNESVSPISLLNISSSPQSIKVNIENISIHDNQMIRSELAQIVGGDITYNENDQQLITLFEKYTEHLEAINLKTSLEELKDTSTPKDERLTAKQKIMAFLYEILPKIGEKAAMALMDYLLKTYVGL